MHIWQGERVGWANIYILGSTSIIHLFVHAGAIISLGHMGWCTDILLNHIWHSDLSKCTIWFCSMNSKWWPSWLDTDQCFMNILFWHGMNFKQLNIRCIWWRLFQFDFKHLSLSWKIHCSQFYYCNHNTFWQDLKNKTHMKR